MKAQATLCAMLLLLAGGCGQPAYYWYQPGKRLERAREDYCACKRYAQTEARQALADEYPGFAPSPGGQPYPSVAARDEFGPIDDPLDAWLSWGQAYQHNVFAGCMKKRGYAKVKPHRLPSGVRTRSLYMGALAGQ